METGFGAIFILVIRPLWSEIAMPFARCFVLRGLPLLAVFALSSLGCAGGGGSGTGPGEDTVLEDVAVTRLDVVQEVAAADTQADTPTDTLPDIPSDTPADTPADTCTPDCDGKECGGDGCVDVCGGECDEGFLCEEGGCLEECVPDEGCTEEDLPICTEDGTGVLTCTLVEEGCLQWSEPEDCPDNYLCEKGECVPDCVPDCTGKECGPDGCGGHCGDCPEVAPICTEEGKCQLECFPDCGSKECGPDGCGGHCGDCDDGDLCTTETCSDGTCTTLPVICDDGDPCTVGITCEEGICTTGASLDDGLPCEMADICEGTCLGGVCMEQAFEICDGQDNNCNGLVDEGLDSPDGAGCAGYGKGVCQVGLAASCTQGVWSCTYSDVLNYEPAEVSCDGLDNDCDGLTDDNLDWEISPGLNTCKKEGVCDPALVFALCSGTPSGWLCNYNAVLEYTPNAEQLGDCDGLDNDCDGLVDESACGPCMPCDSDESCLSGDCSSTPYDDTHYCAVGFSFCVMEDLSTGWCTPVSTDQIVCVSDQTRGYCQYGDWIILPDCGGETPVCVSGLCVCQPDCDEKFCGEDGCGGSCGECGCGEECEVGACVFHGCDGKVCGDDGCGGLCLPGCFSQFACETGVCVCQPDCDEKVCGDDGCGGACGECAEDFACQGGACVGEDQECDDGNDIAWDGCTEGKISEFQVNATSESAQMYPSVAAFSDRSFVVGWHGVYQDSILLKGYVRVFDPEGYPLGDDVLLDDSEQSGGDVKLVGLDSGRFLAIWKRASNSGWTDSLMARLFEHDATPVWEPVTLHSNPLTYLVNIDIAQFDDGSFFVTWRSLQQDLSHTDTYGQLFDTEGNPVWEKLTLRSDECGQYDLSVAALSQTDLALVWTCNEGMDGCTDGVCGQLFTTDGTPLGEVFEISTPFLGLQYGPTVSGFSDEGFMVLWTGQQFPFLQKTIQMQLYGPGAVAQGFPMSASQWGAEDSFLPFSTTFEDDRFVAAWNRGGFNDDELVVRVFDSDATPLSDEFTPTNYALKKYPRPKLATFSDDSFIVVWGSYPEDSYDGEGQDGSGSGIFAQRYNPDFTKRYR
ncbi:MAG: hypothetical protein ABIK09_10025 [Pseudomonadota bacterium]